MSENKNDRDMISSYGGVFNDLAVRIKLIMRLMADPRVSPLIKLLPLGSLLYFVFPDIAPGPIDDVVVIWLGSFLFVELCPPDVVQEHMDELTKVVNAEWKNSPDLDDQIVDGEYRDLND